MQYFFYCKEELLHFLIKHQIYSKNIFLFWSWLIYCIYIYVCVYVVYRIAKADLLSIVPLSVGLLFFGLTNFCFLLPLKSKLDILFKGLRQISSLSDIDFIFWTTYVPPNLECLQFDMTLVENINTLVFKFLIIQPYFWYQNWLMYINFIYNIYNVEWKKFNVLSKKTTRFIQYLQTFIYL